MSRTRLVIIAGAVISALLIAAVVVIRPDGSYKIDDSIVPRDVMLPPLEDKVGRPVGAMSFPDGDQISFAESELIVNVKDDKDLERLVSAYNAQVLRRQQLGSSDADTGKVWILLRIDPTRSGLDDLDVNLEKIGLKEKILFSSEHAARTVAAYVREAGQSVSLNLQVDFDVIPEHPSSMSPTGTAYLDASTWAWMTEDDDLSTPDVDDGLSVGVIHAWDYLKYKKILQGEGLHDRPFVAIVDGGFDLTGSGAPAHGNLDFDNRREPPRQIDVVDYDGSANGANQLQCGGGPCPWHGQGAFGAAAAYPTNQYGSAGSGGEFVRPILVRTGSDVFTVVDGIRAAALAGADVISLSLRSNCGDWAHFVCSALPDDMYEMFYQAVALARSGRSIVIASAGNEGVDVAGLEGYPCFTEGVICVGGVDGSGKNLYNFGEAVDIWAPGCVYSTVSPASASRDANDFGVDELVYFCGTSASAPFTAGIVGLMKAADPLLSTEQVLEALQSSANPSRVDSNVRGYTDAFRAVAMVAPNDPPDISFTRPQSGQLVGWRQRPTLAVAYSDPEVLPDDIYRWSGTVTFTSDKDGFLCVATSPPYSCQSQRDRLTLGQHRISAKAVDAFDATSTAVTGFSVVNRPPSIQIGEPNSGAPSYSHIPTRLRAYILDLDEQLEGSSVSWTSDRDGALGVGFSIKKVLSAGHHVVTASVVDGLGASTTDTVAVTVTPGGGTPLPKIIKPVEGFSSPGQDLLLEGVATDEEDGLLTGASLEWFSSVDGYLGSGNEVTVVLSAPPQPCKPEFRIHQVRLVATDSDGNEVTVQKQVSVGQVC